MSSHCMDCEREYQLQYKKRKANPKIPLVFPNDHLFSNGRTCNECAEFKRAKIFISTSLYEGHPISILEAMSIGLPIVASKVTGNTDTIKNNFSGLFYRLGDINEAVKCIEKIMKNNDLKSKISNNSFLTHRKLFTTKKMKNEYLSLYKENNKYL